MKAKINWCEAWSEYSLDFPDETIYCKKDGWISGLKISAYPELEFLKEKAIFCRRHEYDFYEDIPDDQTVEIPDDIILEMCKKYGWIFKPSKLETQLSSVVYENDYAETDPDAEDSPIRNAGLI